MTSTGDLQEKLRTLHDYSACDVSDALLKLQKPEAGKIARGGYLADIALFALGKAKVPEEQEKIIAPACTLKLVGKASSQEALSDDHPGRIPKGNHWVDMTETGTIVVIDQPEGQSCAAIGGIMAQRMKVNGVKACVVGGRVRDLAELRATGLPVFALAKSTVGTGAEAKVHARNVPISVTGVSVSPGDIVFCDPLEGVVVIPQALLDETIALMPKLVAADDKVKEVVAKGMTVAEAFNTFRQ